MGKVVSSKIWRRAQHRHEAVLVSDPRGGDIALQADLQAHAHELGDIGPVAGQRIDRRHRLRAVRVSDPDILDQVVGQVEVDLAVRDRDVDEAMLIAIIGHDRVRIVDAGEGRRGLAQHAPFDGASGRREKAAHRVPDRKAGEVGEHRDGSWRHDFARS
jgi:hypothetical protein